MVLKDVLRGKAPKGNCLYENCSLTSFVCRSTDLLIYFAKTELQIKLCKIIIKLSIEVI